MSIIKPNANTKREAVSDGVLNPENSPIGDWLILMEKRVSACFLNMYDVVKCRISFLSIVV